jgi:integrative and conjugative element protein (TIGR02256 family)
MLESTFRGSFADVIGLTARMTNVAASWLSKKQSDLTPKAFAMDLSGGRLANGPAREIEFTWPPDHLLRDHRHGYQIRLSRDARASLLSWIRLSERVSGDRTETGGVLFGEVDEFLKVIWIDEVSGPPPDSVASPAGFLCGTAGVRGMDDEKKKRTRGSVTFVGMWHTHPKGLPKPSPTDLGAMKELLQEGSSFLGRRFLMLIVGGTFDFPIASASVFERSDYGS